MKTSNMEIESVKKHIEEVMHYPYIERFLNKPIIDEEKLAVIMTIIHNQSVLSEIEKERYITTAVLVQVALDTHERVLESHESNPEFDRLPNQLKVLAGDYYSGLYYYLLSEIDDIQMIHILATAIKEINENKMNLYYMKYFSIDEYLELVKKINFGLIDHISVYLNDTSLNDVASEWLLLCQLTKEIDVLEREQNTQNENPDSFYQQLVHVWKTKSLSLSNKVGTIPDKHATYQKYLKSRISNW
ncbi:hypothetical protein D8M04_02710 [Oceanobacillus piezotolerans]|uniref:Heptaprenyl diphosphate synthase n=1 Tax=Oceanobacillus piezotolerans TaxID=2448030 RepID=A0A498DFA1_9BACI|nr:heptaprenyl diphosphate synthase component 1 [Oceanobacillus piezotolerans]RLL48205.1 hypothetical protein D8M04_02710 [Oceanobacillus piezotolerans]